MALIHALKDTIEETLTITIRSQMRINTKTPIFYILVYRFATFCVPPRNVKFTEIFPEVTHGQLFPIGSSPLNVG